LPFFSEYWFGPASLLRRRLTSRIRRNLHIENPQFQWKLDYLSRNQSPVLSCFQDPFSQTRIQSRIRMAGFTYKCLQKMYPTPTERHFKTQIRGVELLECQLPTLRRTLSPHISISPTQRVTSVSSMKNAAAKS
jgi:hypothetical protein